MPLLTELAASVSAHEHTRLPSRPHRHGHRAQLAAARLGGFEPVPLGGGVALELLEPAAQARAVVRPYPLRAVKIRVEFGAREGYL